MRRLGLKEEGKGSEGGGFGRTVVVGVKLDAQSRELLTWALVKVTEPGDRVVALHVLQNKDMIDKEGKSSLLSLMKAFESVISIYEGFCNLKQIDLKFKICRGSSIRRVLVQEAKSIAAATVVVGITRKNCTIGFLASIAKYCTRKLPRECWVLAVNNGKVVFQSQRESTGPCSSLVSGDDMDLYDRPLSFLGALRRTRSKNSKVFNGKTSETVEERNEKNDGRRIHHELELDCIGIDIDNRLQHSSRIKTCSICAPDSASQAESPFSEGAESSVQHRARSTEEAGDDSLALIPTETSDSEAASSSISSLTQDLLEMKPGWPLLHRAIINGWQATERSKFREIPVVEWAMQLPARHSTEAVHDDHKPLNAELTTTTIVTDPLEDGSNFDEESEAIVVGSATSTSTADIELNILATELKSLHKKYSSKCRLFSYQELQSATSDFSTDKLIGKGGNSKVYKGHLPDGKELAVKILKSSEDALKEFLSEIEIISTLHHKNIISLFGFCSEENKLILVYDFMAKGNLEENLHGRKDHIVLSWAERYKVAVGAAGALDYLHSSSAQPVIHRDVKSSNILLNDDFEPQLSDFGLSTWSSKSSAQITCSDVAGTFGYLAPEYFMYGRVSDKIDVYAFGVILLELLSGRKPISNEYPKGQESLVMWAKPILQSGKFMQLLDPSLGDKYDNNQLEKMVLAASLCIRRAPRFRPRMSLILKLLQGDDAVMKWASLQVIASEEFDVLYDEVSPASDIQSYLNLALLDVEDDSISVSSIEQSVNYVTAHKSLEDYFQERWSRTSSFD